MFLPEENNQREYDLVTRYLACPNLDKEICELMDRTLRGLDNELTETRLKFLEDCKRIAALKKVALGRLEKKLDILEGGKS